MELTVVDNPTGGRKVILDESISQTFLSEGGRVYQDQNWKVSLYKVDAFGKGEKPMVAVIYTGENAVGEKQMRKRIAFKSGKLSLCLENSLLKDGSIGSLIVPDRRSFDDILIEEYGILNGYCYDSPNQVWTSKGLETCNLRIVSDGTVLCTVNGVEMLLPTISDLHRIQSQDEVEYEVRCASWTVVSYTDETDTKQVWLYTQAEDWNGLLVDLDEYLEAAEISGFEDL